MSIHIQTCDVYFQHTGNSTVIEINNPEHAKSPYLLKNVSVIQREDDILEIVDSNNENHQNVYIKGNWIIKEFKEGYKPRPAVGLKSS